MGLRAADVGDEGISHPGVNNRRGERYYRHEEQEMNKYLPAILSALVVIVLAAAYAVFWFLVIDDAEMVNAVRIIIASISLFVVIGVAWALISRIRELRGGQEDDLGKY